MKASTSRLPSKTQTAEKIARAMIELGGKFRVTGYHTGDFVGECTRVGAQLAEFRILEIPRDRCKPASELCPFVGCVLEPDHDDDHKVGYRVGGFVEVWICHAKIERVHDVLGTAKLQGESREAFERDRFGQSGGSR